MPEVKEGEKGVYVALPVDVVSAVEDYRFTRRLSHVKLAYAELLRKGLEAVKEKAPRG